ncbi:hypothetical protein BCR44DRAFT_57545 [Catenaria anguillulae PL171]|uniref:Uncharacterized protein n=1 Tax=Catenaria anguillulae PL171 TaxID=765915 RepID=A0A1Y2HFZ1_9FUNG|nr:hypothetical protein BCR44DRAFT_57545 [Catenaria anguillulae PL171]
MHLPFIPPPPAVVRMARPVLASRRSTWARALSALVALVAAVVVLCSTVSVVSASALPQQPTPSIRPGVSPSPTASAAPSPRASSTPALTPAKSWADEALAEYGQSNLMVVMGINLTLSSLILVTSLRSALRSQTWFHWGVVFGAIWFSVNDISYFMIVGLHTAPNAFEIIRTITPVFTASLISGLSLERFRVFGNTTYARWYTQRVRITCLAINYLVLVVSVGILVSTFIGIDLTKEIALNPARKLTIVSALGFNIIVDLILTIMIFRIVLKIRAALDSNSALGTMDTNTTGATSGVSMQRKAKRKVSPEYRANVLRVLLAVCAMFVLSFAGVGVYFVSGGVMGDMSAAIMARLYILAAMVQWYLIVDIVRRKSGSSNGSTTGNGTSTYGGANSSHLAPPSQTYPMKPVSSTGAHPSYSPPNAVSHASYPSNATKYPTSPVSYHHSTAPSAPTHSYSTQNYPTSTRPHFDTSPQALAPQPLMPSATTTPPMQSRPIQYGAWGLEEAERADPALASRRPSGPPPQRRHF